MTVATLGELDGTAPLGGRIRPNRRSERMRAICLLPRFKRRSRRQSISNQSPFLEDLGEQGSEENAKTKCPGKPMSQNLNLLRQKYCRPATFTGKRTDHLFRLEEECE